jgi:aminopeptidase 2
VLTFPFTSQETGDGFTVRQNRFLSTGDPSVRSLFCHLVIHALNPPFKKDEEDSTIWQVPLFWLTVDGGKPLVDREAFLTKREAFFPLPGIKDAVFKINSGTYGVCECLSGDQFMSGPLNLPARLQIALSTLPNDSRSSATKLREGLPPSPSMIGTLPLADALVNSLLILRTRFSMGLVQDASVLAAAGYSRTSSSLTLISKLKNETENLVWAEISSSLSSLAAVWWEQAERDREGISNFRRSLFAPIASRLGFEFGKDDDPDEVELRTMAISVAATCGEPK